MEEITRIKFGTVSQPKAVDSSPSRRLDVALRNLARVLNKVLTNQSAL